MGGTLAWKRLLAHERLSAGDEHGTLPAAQRRNGSAKNPLLVDNHTENFTQEMITSRLHCKSLYLFLLFFHLHPHLALDTGSVPVFLSPLLIQYLSHSQHDISSFTYKAPEALKKLCDIKAVIITEGEREKHTSATAPASLW